MATDGSPRKMGDGAAHGGRVDDGGDSDKRSSTVKIESWRGSRPVRFSSKRWLGRGCTRDGDRRWLGLNADVNKRGCQGGGFTALDSHGREWW
jgi:hypothetical protein